MNTVDTEASLDQFKSAIREEEKKAKQKSISIRWGRYATVAAIFLTGFVFAGGIVWGLLSNKLPDYEVITVAGQRVRTVLPDGSKVRLNTPSKIVYHNSLWSSDRQVDLSGEAYFEVSYDKYAPSIVNSKQIKICALGTKFSMCARQDENRVVTTLLQGLVRVDFPRTGENGYLLKPGQTLNANTDAYRAELIEYNQPTDVLLWISGKLEFKQQSLLETTNIMGKSYDIKFIYKDGALKPERSVGEFSTGSTADEMLNVLMYTNHFSYKKDGWVVRVMKK